MYKVCLLNNRILLPTIEVLYLNNYLNHRNNILSEIILSWSFGLIHHNIGLLNLQTKYLIEVLLALDMFDYRSSIMKIESSQEFSNFKQFIRKNFIDPICDFLVLDNISGTTKWKLPHSPYFKAYTWPKNYRTHCSRR